MFEARVKTTQGTFELDVEMTVPGRGVTAIFGASGAGKTVLLRCIAGLIRAETGRVQLNGECWQDENRGLFVPTHRRALGFVFQEASLFPHLTVRQNLVYGWRRVPAERRQITMAEAVEWMGIESLLSRRPDGLSVGERKRVAIARTILTSPVLLLMDEPLAGLDEPSRNAIMPCLERLVDRLEVPVLYVSHHVMEVVRLADHLVWIDAGRVRATGSPQDVLVRLGSSGSAAELGVFLNAAVAEHDDEFGLSALVSVAGRLWIQRVDLPVGGAVRVQVLATDVSLALSEERDSSILNVLPARVAAIDRVDESQVIVRLACGDGSRDPGSAAPLLARITRKSCTRLGLAPGVRVYARVKSVSLIKDSSA